MGRQFIAGLKTILSNKRGSTAVLTVLIMAVLMGAAGLAMDSGLAYMERYRIQNALDAAVLAGAQEFPDMNAARNVAVQYAVANGLDEEDVAVVTQNGRLTATTDIVLETTFMRVLGIQTFDVSGLAAAEGGADSVFSYTLFSGSTTNNLNLNGNDLLIDGTTHTNDELRINGNLIELTGAAEAVDGIEINGGAISVGMQFPNSSVMAMPDYMDEVRNQAQTSGYAYTGNKKFNGNTVYVDNSVYVTGTATLNGNQIQGAGALLAEQDIRLNGNALSATTNDQVALYAGRDIKINGNDITVDGILYAPNGEIHINGNNITIRGRVIAKEVKINGNDIDLIGDGIEVISLPLSKPRLVQ